MILVVEPRAPGPNVWAGAGCGVHASSCLRYWARKARSARASNTPTDPTALGAACAFMLLVGVAATYVPARRAAMVDPVIELKREG